MSNILFKRATFFLLYVFTVFVYTDIAAETTDNSQYVARPAVHKASNPECAMYASTATITAAVAGLAGLKALYTSYAVFTGATSLTVKTAAGIAFAAAVGTASAVYSNMNVVMLLGCMYSFVRHPVLYDVDNGNYKTCEDPIDNPYSTADESVQICPSLKYIPTDKYEYPKNSTMGSDYIEVCSRSIFGTPWLLFIDAIGGVGAKGYGTLNSGAVLDREREIAAAGDSDSDVNDARSSSMGLDVYRGDIECQRIKADQKVTLLGHSFGLTFKSYERGSKICVDLWGNRGVAFWPVGKIGCHLREPSPPGPLCKASVAIMDSDGKVVGYDNRRCYGCYISSSCYNKAGLASRTVFPITGLVVQCIKESIENVITGTCIDPVTGNLSETKGTLIVVLEKLYRAIKAAVVLAIMLFGIKLFMGGVRGVGEASLLILKVVIVLYLTMGDVASKYYTLVTKASVGLSDLILSATSSNGVCDFHASDYEAKEYTIVSEDNPSDTVIVYRDNTYMAPWDRLDCRVLFYLGQSLNSTLQVGGMGAAGLAVFVAPFPLALVLLIVPLIFAGNIILAITIFLFLLILLLMIIWTVHLFILSFIGLSLLALLSPIFIPMMLFQATKNFFDGWLKELIAYSLYPVILFAFLSLAMVIFDKLYFDDLKFEKEIVERGEGFRPAYKFNMSPEDQCSKKTLHCIDGITTTDTAGNITCLGDQGGLVEYERRYINFACMINDVKFFTKPLILGLSVTAADIKADTKEFWKKLGSMLLMGFLFYHFLGVINQFAAELTGSWRADVSRGASSPGEMAGKIAGAAASVASKAQDVGKQIARGVGGNKGGGEGSSGAG